MAESPDRWKLKHLAELGAPGWLSLTNSPSEEGMERDATWGGMAKARFVTPVWLPGARMQGVGDAKGHKLCRCDGGLTVKCRPKARESLRCSVPGVTPMKAAGPGESHGVGGRLGLPLDRTSERCVLAEPEVRSVLVAVIYAP